MESCTLCEEKAASHFHSTDSYDYLHCQNCDLIFVKPGQRLDSDEEKKRYDYHENDPDDVHYREFLNQLFLPLSKKLKQPGVGLDFGSGPGPALNVMFEEAGHKMKIYDPFYADDPGVFNQQYDFITSTETAEHLFYPRKEFEKMWACLKPGGFLGIMTKMVQNISQFPGWHYMRDDTHVTFYSKKTFNWLAAHWKASVNFDGTRVIIFEKSLAFSSDD